MVEKIRQVPAGTLVRLSFNETFSVCDEELILCSSFFIRTKKTLHQKQHQQPDGHVTVSCGGETINSAVYLTEELNMIHLVYYYYLSSAVAQISVTRKMKLGPITRDPM